MKRLKEPLVFVIEGVNPSLEALRCDSAHTGLVRLETSFALSWSDELGGVMAPNSHIPTGRIAKQPFMKALRTSPARRVPLARSALEPISG